jgi:transposase
MLDVNELVQVVFGGLSPLVVEDVKSEGGVVRVWARTPQTPTPCPVCGTLSARVHAYAERTLADVPVGSWCVAVVVRLRRLVCPVLGCARQTFREQVPGVVERYQRRTSRLACQIGAVVRELAGRAGTRVLSALNMAASQNTALRVLRRAVLPERPVPRVLGIDDFSLRKGRVYATVLIDATTGKRVDVIEGRGAQAVTDWLRAHPGVEVVCRDGSTVYAQAVRQALPGAVQVADRWHLWHGPADAVGKEVAAHSACWSGATGLRTGRLARTTRERWQQVHDLREAGVGLLDCARRLGLALNTVKRYVRAEEPEKIARVPKYRACLVDPYRDHLRRRREENPGVSVQQLLREIREQGYDGSQNLLYRYLNQQRHLDDQPHLSPRRATRLLLTRPDRLTERQAATVQRLTASCPEMRILADLVTGFAALLAPDERNEAGLKEWTGLVQASDLPHLHSFVRGLEQDHDAVVAGLTLDFHNGRTEGVNTKIKMIKRQMYGRASFPLLRHRILLG